MKPLKLIIVIMCICHWCNAQNLKNSGIGYSAIKQKGEKDALNSHAVKQLTSPQLLLDEKTFAPLQMINAYPNPFKTAVNLVLNYKHAGIVKLEAYNSIGKLVYTSTMHTVNRGTCNVAYDLADLAEGLYLFKVYTFDNSLVLNNQYSFKSLKIN